MISASKARLVALDTPERLKRTYVPERVLVVRGPGLHEVAPRLRAHPGIHAATPFGAGLHLRVDPDVCSDEEVTRVISEAGGEAIVEATEPSLEDVFLAVVRGSSNGEDEAA